MIKPETTKVLWDKVGSDFFGSDLVFANLETPIDMAKKSSFVPEVMLNDMHFNTDEATFSIFSGSGHYKGYDVLSVANNHTMDMGEAGLDATLWYLEQQTISAIGAKHHQSEPDFVIRSINGISIGFVAYTFSLNQLLPPDDKPWKVNYLPLNLADCPTDRIEKDVKACREAGAEFIICSLHFGNAYQVYPSLRSIQLVEQLFEKCGIDIIAGGHPHNLQPWRYYHYTHLETGRQKTGFAIYSLADFVAYDIYTWCHLCAWLKVSIGRDAKGEVAFTVKVNPLVMRRENNQLQLAPAEPLLEGITDDALLHDLKILYDICKDSQLS
jgi:poly-gamma-glutamate synthesis protein (capsule biosynthesis protein)